MFCNRISKQYTGKESVEAGFGSSLGKALLLSTKPIWSLSSQTEESEVLIWAEK